mgnify:CR=1 FL=1
MACKQKQNVHEETGLRYAEAVGVTSEGIVMSSSALEHLGVYEGSQCWGLWVSGRSTRDTSATPGREREIPHLIISPVEPDLWLTMAYLNVRMHNHPGTLAAALKGLQKHDVNLLSIECSPAGYNHATLSGLVSLEAIGDVRRDLIERLNVIEKEYFGDRGTLDNLRESSFRELGSSVIRAIQAVENGLRLDEHRQYDHYLEWAKQRELHPSAEALDAYSREAAPDDLFYLAPRVVEQGTEPWFLNLSDPGFNYRDWYENPPEHYPKRHGPEDIITLRRRMRIERKDHVAGGGPTTGALLAAPSLGGVDGEQRSARAMQWLWGRTKRVFERHWTQPIFMRAILPLAYARVWKDPETVPVKLKYQGRLLRPEESDKDAFWRVVNPTDAARPRMAIAAYSHTDKLVRVKWIQSRDAGRMARVRVQYDFRASSEAQQPASSSAGVLECITSAFRANVQLVRVTNAINSVREDGNGRHRSEKGTLDFIGELGEEANPASCEVLEQSIAFHAKKWSDTQSGRTLEVEAEASAYTGIRVFLSCAHDSASRLKLMIPAVCDEYGVTLRVADQNTEDVAEVVMREVRRCDAFLQIIAFPENEKLEQALESGNRPWLSIE